jgi:hypothetical protein
MSKSMYPAKDGWLKMTMTMKSKAPHSEDDLKRLASFGKPEQYEFAVVEQYGSRVKVIFRSRPNRVI